MESIIDYSPDEDESYNFVQRSCVCILDERYITDLSCDSNITTTRMSQRIEPFMPATGSYVLVALSYHCLAGFLVVPYSPVLGNLRPGHTTPA
jgi:hypothetical protein